MCRKMSENKAENTGVQWIMVIARVAGRDYLTKVAASSLAGAEHEILDMGYVGKGGVRAVEASQAFGIKEMKTDYFAYNALDATPIYFEDLKKVIWDRNEAIKNAERAVVRIAEIEEALDMLEAELEQAKKIAGAA